MPVPPTLRLRLSQWAGQLSSSGDCRSVLTMKELITILIIAIAWAVVRLTVTFEDEE